MDLYIYTVRIIAIGALLGCNHHVGIYCTMSRWFNKVQIVSSFRFFKYLSHIWTITITASNEHLTDVLR